MKKLIFVLWFLVVCQLLPAQDNVDNLKNLFSTLKGKSSNELFARNYQSIIDVINAETNLSESEITYLNDTYAAFINTSNGLQEEETYKMREFPLIIAWKSKTDNAVSYTKLRLPKNWDPNKAYPLYIQLHGLWSVANSAIDFMTYSYRRSANTSYSFEDGYMLDPWGRGNYWYEGISETDIWEGIEVIESMLKIDATRKYLTGHSMGGYGAWYIGGKSVDTWAALGIHAGALQYDASLVSTEMAEKFVNMPVYFVCGTSDWLLDINTQAYNYLLEAGNPHVQFTTFEGGHDYIEENVEHMYDWLHQFQKSTSLKSSQIKNQYTYPNPFNVYTDFNVWLKNPGKVSIYVYDPYGRKTTILKDFYLTNGKNIVRWQPSQGTKGLYIYEIISNGEKQSGKLMYY